MFRAVFLPIIRSFSAVQRHWHSSCSSVTECYQDRDGTRCICWFYSQGICHDARSYNPKKKWPIQLAFRLLISCRIFLCSLTLSNTSSFLTWYPYNVGKICSHIRIRITDLQKPVKVYHLRGQGQIMVESSLLPASANRLAHEYLLLLFLLSVAW
jgi:hypothetical protein